jgi:hypothetical protein
LLLYTVAYWSCAERVKCRSLNATVARHKNYPFGVLRSIKKYNFFFWCGAATQRGSWPPHSRGFLDHTRRTTVGRTPLDEWSARRRDLYLTTHNTHNRQTSVPLEVFEPKISAGERPQNYALDRAATGTGKKYNYIRQWHLAGYGLTEVCAGIVGRTVAILLSSIVVLTPNGSFWVVPLLHSVSGMISLYFRALWSARHRKTY